MFSGTGRVFLFRVRPAEGTANPRSGTGEPGNSKVHVGTDEGARAVGRSSTRLQEEGCRALLGLEGAKARHHTSRFGGLMPGGATTDLKTYSMLINAEWVASNSAETVPAYDASTKDE